MKVVIKILSVFTLITGLLALSQPVKAADPPDVWGGWEIQVDAPSNNLRVLFYARVYEQIDNNTAQLRGEVTFDMTATCQVFGGPTIANEKIEFDGVDDYISCPVPNYAEAFAKIEESLASCRCHLTNDPYVGGDIAPVYPTNPNSQTMTQPVITHEALEFDVITHNPTRAYSELKLFIDNTGPQVTQQSENFRIGQAAGNQLWSGYNAYIYKSAMTGWKGFLADLFTDVDRTHLNGFSMLVDSNSPVYNAAPLNPGFVIGTDTTVYIGHNPAGPGTFYEGSMTKVVFDPGCRGH